VSPRALWLPYAVSSKEGVDSATRFYTDHLGLSKVDGWDRDGERGMVLRAAGEAFLEFVSPGAQGETPIAFELADERAVDERFRQWTDAQVLREPRQYPRGHYGFEVRGPAGARVMVWSEK